MEDVIALLTIMKKVMLLKQCLNLTAFLCHGLSSILNSCVKKKKIDTLEHFVTCAVQSKRMSEKIAKFGLYCQHFQLYYKRIKMEKFNRSVHIKKS